MSCRTINLIMASYQDSGEAQLTTIHRTPGTLFLCARWCCNFQILSLDPCLVRHCFAHRIIFVQQHPHANWPQSFCFCALVTHGRLARVSRAFVDHQVFQQSSPSLTVLFQSFNEFDFSLKQTKIGCTHFSGIKHNHTRQHLSALSIHCRFPWVCSDTTRLQHRFCLLVQIHDFLIEFSYGEARIVGEIYFVRRLPS